MGLEAAPPESCSAWVYELAPPEAPANGEALDQYIYLVDRASKSAAHCDRWTVGQPSSIQ